MAALATSMATTTAVSAPAPRRVVTALALVAAAAAAAASCPASGADGRCPGAPDLFDNGDSDSSLLQSRRLISRRLGAEDDDASGGMQCGDPAWFYTTEACEASKSGGGGWGQQRKSMATPPQEPCSSESAYPWCATALSAEERAALLVAQMNLTELAEQVSCDIFAGVPSIPRLGVNAYNYIRENDHGLLWNDVCPPTTMFPQAITTAGSFNHSLWREIALASAAETRYNYATGKQNSLFGQVNFNIFIDPRWGRGQEVPGEDPVLTSNYVKEWVFGVQERFNTGNSLSVAASCKHYTAYSLEGAGGWPYPRNDSNRHNFNAVVSNQDLSDTHFPAYEECARQDAQGVMTAYNAVNGIPMAANTRLNEDFLRKRWGFSGLIVTDCGAVEDIWLRHKYVPNGTAAAWAALEGGVDVECGSTIKTNVEPGMLSLLRRAVERSFTVRFRTGEFDFKVQDEPMYDQKLHAKLAYDAAVQGAVLIKNDRHLLPLVDREKIAVVGPLKGGNWEALGNYAAYKNAANWSDSPNVKSVLTGLKDCGLGDKLTVLKDGPYICSATDDIIPGFLNYFEKPDVDVLLVVGGLYCQDEQEQDPDVRPEKSGKCQGGCLESEGCDRPNLDLPKGQRELIARAAKWNIPVVLAIIAGGGMDLSEVEGIGSVQSIIWLGYPGQAAGTALARMLFGLDAPSGKLSFTMYKSAYAEAIGMQQVGMRPDTATGKPGRTYRFVNDKDYILHSFGYGLSYWGFSYEWAEVSTTLSSTTIATTTSPSGEVPCSSEPAGTCTGNPAELCVFDPGCSQTPPTFGGLGCNAGGAGQNCRFCGFAHFEPCEDVSLLAESKASAKEQKVEKKEKFKPCRVAVKVSVREAAKKGTKAEPSTPVLLFLVPPRNVPFEGAPIKFLAKFERMNEPAGDALVFPLVHDDFVLADPDGKRLFVAGDWGLEVQENAELRQTIVVEDGGCFPDK